MGGMSVLHRVHNSSYFALPHVDLACKNVDNLLRKRETAKLERANTVCKTAKLGTRGGGGGGVTARDWPRGHLCGGADRE